MTNKPKEKWLPAYMKPGHLLYWGREEQKEHRREVGMKLTYKTCQKCKEGFYGGHTAKYCIMCKDLNSK